MKLKLGLAGTGFGLMLCLGGCSSRPPAASGPPVVNLAGFEKLKPGMSYDEVKSAVGHEGSLPENSKSPGPGMVTASWANSDGSNMTVIFSDGKVMRKVQTGLK